jgi:multidrug efflux system membrane fusion protein
MVVINQVRPIYVSFSLPERELSLIRSHLSGGKLKVEAQIAGLEGTPEPGQVSFLDNTVDPATATFRLKGVFANTASRLWPGQFVTVLITLSTIQDAVVVPSQAVQTGQEGQYVYVVKGDKAELRQVTAGISHEGMTVIEKGISAEEQVVTDGQMRLMPGASVVIRTPDQQIQAAPSAGKGQKGQL